MMFNLHSDYFFVVLDICVLKRDVNLLSVIYRTFCIALLTIPTLCVLGFGGTEQSKHRI